ncbi:helix-turn-helix domain-containing protein [Streptomyces sp. NPDC059534]|uniref:helix-turn-helix domain-containing protein n=1 Tax=Streptomyces sp. NPDC059534 TaxID=3346859 RepID=UPI00368795D2
MATADGWGGVAGPLEELKLLLRDRRAELGMAMRAVERSAGLGHTTVSKALNGPGVPTRATVIALAKALRTDPEPLLCLHGQVVEGESTEGASTEGGSADARAPYESPVRDFFGDLIEQHTRLFAGRRDEGARVMEFVRDRATGYVFVEALSGFGKTSLLADLVRRHPEFRYHFISQAYRRRGGGFDPTSPEDVLESLCEQLDAAHVRGGGLKSLERQFHALTRRTPPEPTVVVLDAVDELEPPDQLRTLLPRRLPEGLVFVLSGRAQGDRSCLDDIALSPADVGLHLRLAGLDEQALVELLRMAGGRAAALARDTDFVARLHRVSAGDPFYVRFLVEDAASGVLTRDNAERVPTGLESYLDQQLEQLNRSAHRAEHVEILGFLLEAGTLSGMDLCSLVEGLTWLNFDSILREIHRFLLVHRRSAPGLAPRRGSEEYSFCHARFREYFRGRAGIG